MSYFSYDYVMFAAVMHERIYEIMSKKTIICKEKREGERKREIKLTKRKACS